MKNTRRTWPTRSTKQCSYGFTESKETYKGPTLVYISSSAYIYGCQVDIFVRFLIVAMGVSLILMYSRGSFPLIWLPCPVSILGLLPSLIVSYFIVFGGFLKAYFFLERKWRGGGHEGEGNCSTIWKKWRNGKLLLGCIVWEKTIFNKNIKK